MSELTGVHLSSILGPSPLMSLAIAAVAIGAAIAAAVPLTESTIILYNTTNRIE